MTVKALVPAHFVPELQERAEALGVTLVPYDKEGVPQGDSSGSSILFRWWLTVEQGDEIVRRHPDLKWVHTGSAGVDHILTPAFRQADLFLTNSTGVHAASIAEWSVAAILALEKDLPLMLRQQRDRVWEKVTRDELPGKHGVILGAGQIATEIAARLRPFGLRLTCVRRREGNHPLFDRTMPIDRVREAAVDADWLIVTLPLTAVTRGIVDDSLLRTVPPRCRILNVSRGEVIDQRALVRALDEKRIAGAVLDVFATEPLPANDPLWAMENVIILPHTTGFSPKVRRKEIDLFADNLGRYVRDEPLRNVVDQSAGY